MGDVLFAKLSAEAGQTLTPMSTPPHCQPFDYYNKACIVLESVHPKHPIVLESHSHIAEKLSECQLDLKRIEETHWDGLLRLLDGLEE